MTLLRRAIEGMTKAPNTERLPHSPYTGLAGAASGLLGVGNRQAHLSAYGTVGWLFAVVGRIAQGVASAEWMLYRSSRGGDRQELPGHPLLELWRDANPFFTREEFVETFQQHLDLVGESYWLILRGRGNEPRELWPLRPDRVIPIPHRTEHLSGYVYQLGAERIPLEVEDVVFLRLPNPLDIYRGMGPVQALLADLDGERYSAQWNRNFFANSAEPGGIIEFPEGIPDGQWERLVQRWQQQHQGVANAHRVAILEKGHWVDRKFTMRDMQFEQLRRVNRDVILGAYGFPKHLLGIADDVNRANAEAAEVMFSRWIVRPRLARIRAALNERLAKIYGPDLEFDFIDPTPHDRDLALREAVEGFEKHVLTQNEARRRLGEEDVDGGDEFAPWPLNVVPLPAAGAGPEEMAAPMPRLKSADPLLSSPLEAAEAEMRRNWEKRLTAEGRAVADYLGSFKGLKVEVVDVDGYDWDWFSRHGPATIEELTNAFALAFNGLAPDLGPTQAHLLAEQYAKHRGAMLLRLDGDLNLVRQTQERIRDLVAQTIEEGGSVRALQQAIRDDFVFSASRAEMVARTETATALGQGEKAAALAQGRDQKHWMTQGDDRVSEDCRANEAAGWIAASELFPSGKDTIPQHPRCRCVCRYRTAPQPKARLLAEARCRQCGKLLGKNVPETATLYCRRCKVDVALAGDVIEAAPEVVRTVRKAVERDEEGRITAVVEEELA